jgi:hypothetical protein
MSEPLAEEVFRLAGEGIEVPATPLEQVATRARAQQRRRRRWAAGIVSAVLVAVVAPATLLAAWRGADQPPVERVDNPAILAWWADDVLHLDHVAVGLSGVTDLVQVGAGAVIGDEDGDVVLVDPSGRVTTIGHKAADQPLVGSDRRGWVAWVDPRDGAPRLEVYDVGDRRQLTSRDLPPPDPGDPGEGGHPIAVDGDQIFYAAVDGDWGWVPDEVGRVDVKGLLDVAAATIVRRAGTGRIRIVQPFFSVSYVRYGEGARLSPGGEFVLTRLPGGTAEAPVGPVLIYDTRTGKRIWTGLHPEDLVVAATLGPLDTVSYVIAHGGEAHARDERVRSFTGPYDLRTCDLVQHSCYRAVTFQHAGDVPLLAS